MVRERPEHAAPTGLETHLTGQTTDMPLLWSFTKYNGLDVFIK